MDGDEHGGAENEGEEQRFRRWNRNFARVCAAFAAAGDVERRLKMWWEFG